MKTLRTFAMLLAAAVCSLALSSCSKDDSEADSIPSNPCYGKYTMTLVEGYVDGKLDGSYRPSETGQVWILNFKEDGTFEEYLVYMEGEEPQTGAGTFAWDSENCMIAMQYESGTPFMGYISSELGMMQVRSWTDSKLVIVYGPYEEDGKSLTEVFTLTK